MTLVPNFPAQSDHLGIVFDIDMASYFSSSFSDLGNNPPRSLTSGNKRSVDTYIKYVSEQLDNHNIERRISDLYRSLSEISTIFSTFQRDQLNNIDTQVTEILLAGERQCARKKLHRQPWSPPSDKLHGRMHIKNKNLLCQKRNVFIGITSRS
jgi:hypothetical protein